MVAVFSTCVSRAQFVAEKRSTMLNIANERALEQVQDSTMLGLEMNGLAGQGEIEVESSNIRPDSFA